MSLRKEPTIKRIEFEGGDWIDVKETRNYGDTVAAQKAASIRRTVSADDKSDDGVAFEFDAVGFNLALLERMIVEWSDDEPINQETIQELPDSIVQEVMTVITDSLESQDEEEKKA